jgi:hypothetical protein
VFFIHGGKGYVFFHPFSRKLSKFSSTHMTLSITSSRRSLDDVSLPD